MTFRLNSFQIGNSLVDQCMRIMTPKEFICLTLIIRKTRGWNKESHKISISQFQEFTGIKREKSLSAALESLRGRGFIKVIKSRGRVNEYQLSALFSELENAPISTGKNATTGKYATGKNPVDNSQNHRQIRHSTKGTYTKGEETIKNNGSTKEKPLPAAENPPLLKQGIEFGLEPFDKETSADFTMRVIAAMSRNKFDAMQG